jgi:poly(A) polymerase
MEEHAHLLRDISGERITEELYKIIYREDSYSWICRMDEAGILEVIFPIIGEMRDVNQGPYHHLDIWRHSLEALKELECVLAEFLHNDVLGEKIKDYLVTPLGGERCRLFMLKLGTLFHDIGKPRAKEITEENKIRFIGHERIGAKLVSEMAENLRLSSKEKNSLIKLVNLHLRPGCLVDTQDISPRAKLRFFRAAEEDSVALILLALSDKRATRGPLTTAESQIAFNKYLSGVIKDYFYQKELVKPVKLLDGDQVMRILGISSGKAVGDIIKELEEAQVEKKVNTREEAEEFIKHMFKNNQEATGN